MNEKAKFYNIYSFSNEDKSYRVRKLQSGEWRCSCPFFVYKLWGGGVGCKHIKAAKWDLAGKLEILRDFVMNR